MTERDFNFLLLICAAPTLALLYVLVSAFVGR